MHPETKIHTEFGLMRICDVDRPMRVLSWNQKTQQYQLSLSGGAYRKGRANLYRVVTQQGEFVASGHHHVLCADCSYQPVDSLSAGQRLSSSYQFLSGSSLGPVLKLSPSSAQHYSETVASLMGDYASANHLCDRQLQEDQALDRSFAPLLGGAQQCAPIFLMSDLEGMELSHIHLCLLCAQISKMGYQCRIERRALVVEGQKQALSFVRTSLAHQEDQQSLAMSSTRHKDGLYSSVCHSYESSSIKSTKILSITQEHVKSDYYDIQVLETNNYITEDGCIHHNSGKTFVGCLDLLSFFAKHPGTRQGYFGPSYPSIRDIFYPTFEEAAEMMGFRVVVRESNKEVHVYRGGRYYGTVICRSMDNPSSIVGFKISRALCDELDVLNQEKAKHAWNKIIARMRLVINGVPNSIGVTTTPEGFKFVYSQFAKDPTSSYSMVQASTYENELYLPPDYISSLRETYPANLIDAYLDGQFVNLTGGTVYNQYTNENLSSETIQESDSTLHIGMDFNVTQMAACVFVYRDKNPHCVDEFAGLYDTRDMIEHIQARYPSKRINVYPDASGKNRKSNGADQTDLDLLKKAGFHVYAKDANPRVKTRVNATNAMFCNANNERKLFVNKEKCPETHDCLTQQVYDDKGEPDKKGGKDHQNDAFGYPIVYLHPIQDRLSKAFKMSR